MKLIRYKTKPERTQENAELIAKVFEELHATAPGDVGYLALRLADGSFVHIVAAETEEGGKRIPQLKAFDAFRSGAAERQLEPAQVNEATVIGNYRILRE